MPEIVTEVAFKYPVVLGLRYSCTTGKVWMYSPLLCTNWQITFESVPPKHKLEMRNLKCCFHCQHNKQIVTNVLI